MNNRNEIWKIYFLVFLLIVLFTLSGCTNQPKLNKFLDEPDVKILVEVNGKTGGHGSGVVLAGGFVLTAAHVVKVKGATFEIKTQTNRMIKAELLWINEKYDIAALKIETDQFKQANLNCASAKIGQPVALRGHPYNLEFLETSGKIIGRARKVWKWESVMVTNAVVGPGMSGGAAYSEYGEIVGFTVGLRTMQVGMGGGPSGFGFIVPSSVACKLIGRQ